MSKAKIIDKKSVDSVLGEKNLLSQLHHSFIVNMVYSFQDHDYLYLVMDLLPGGNLRYHICLKRRFNEKQNKFLIGCILVGLEYIHSQCILHRDIKPENLVFDSNGYLRITDFGIAKKYVVNNKKDTSGTVGYLAPEILCNQNHTYSIDYYAIGIIAYELAYGHRPYIGRTKHEVKQLILTQQAHIDYDELPNGYQDEAADFINQLIQRKPKNRLGRDSISEVINHPWLQGFDWEALKEKNLRAYYIPKEGDNFDKKYCLQSNKLGTETVERYKEITMEPNYNLIFKKFDCEKVPEELKFIENKIKFGETTNNINNNICNSSNNSTASISRNNKISANNENKKAVNNNYILSKQRNKSMENIFMNKNQNSPNEINNNKNNINNNEHFGKMISGININDKENIILNYENDKNIKEENEIKLIKDIEPRNENKLILNKKTDNNSLLNKKQNSSLNAKKSIIRLIDDRGLPIANNLNSNHNSLGNISSYNQKNQNMNNSNNISIKCKDKSAIYENPIDISGLDKSDLKEKEREKESMLFNQKLTNLNQYIMNNYKQKKINKNKIMSSSSSSLNIFQNEIFNNPKGNYFKKIIKNKILNKDISKFKQKNNNSLLNSNSAQNIFKKNSGLNSSYSKPNKKHFLKKDIFNGTFYQNKSSSTKSFFFPRKSGSSSIAKKMEMNNYGNKRLTSSSSIRSLKKIKNDRNTNSNGIFSNVGVESIIHGNGSIKEYFDKNNNIDKNLPFINISLNKKNIQSFRNNFSFANRNNNRNFLNGNGYFSEKIKDNDMVKIKGSINGNYH